MLPSALLVACTGASEPAAVPPPETRRFEIALFTSADGRSWSRATGGPGGLQSLGLSERDDGEIWLTGLRHHGEGELHDADELRGIVEGYRFRGASWQPARWEVADPDSAAMNDPQWFGSELWFMASTGRSGDPVGPDRYNLIRSSPPPRTRHEGQGVADPSPVSFAGRTHLFVTAWPVRIQHLVEGQDGRFVEVHQWPAMTVPFATVVDGELWLYAQGNVEGRRHPMVARSRDALAWTEFEPVIPWDSAQDCTSPVVGRAGGAGVLLCVEELR